jgi:hypothetical protein
VENDNTFRVLKGIKFNAVGILFKGQFKCVYRILGEGFTGSSVGEN